MAINLIKSVNFGSGKGSLSGVGYRLYWTDGELSGSRITAGIGEIIVDSGIYSSSVHFSTDFSGSILWDTGEGTPVYATEDYNSIDEYIHFIHSIEGGKWQIDSSTNQMIFYKRDNSTEVARFDLYDSDGTASITDVFRRDRS